MRRVKAALRPHLAVSLGPGLFLALNAAIVTAAALYAADYVAMGMAGHVPSSLSSVESLFPFWFWAGLIFTGAICIGVGSLRPPRLLLTTAGHLILSALFLAIGGGITASTLLDDIPGGWRPGTGALLCLGVVNFIFAVATERKREAIKRALDDGRRARE